MTKVRAITDCQTGLYEKGDIGTLVSSYKLWGCETYYVHLPEHGVIVCNGKDFEHVGGSVTSDDKQSF